MGFYTNLAISQDGKSYELKRSHTPKAVDQMQRALRSRDPKVKAAVARANEELIQLALTPGTTHQDTALQTMSVQYKNDEYIGLRLMPVIDVGVNNRSGVYFTYDKRSPLGLPDDAIDARGSANEITKARNKQNFSVSDYGLKDFLDQALALNASAPLDEMADLMVDLNDAIDFKEEIRIANIATNPANYAGNTVALSSGSRWDVTGGNPIADLLNADQSLWSGRGPGKRVGFMSLNVWNALVQNAKLQATFMYTQGGLLQPERFADYFGLDELLIGRARQDTANEGQSAAYGRVWPDVFGIVRVATMPSVRNAAFGYTFRAGPKNTDEWFDNGVGVKGGTWGRVSLSEQHLVVAGDTGFLITTPIG